MSNEVTLSQESPLRARKRNVLRASLIVAAVIAGIWILTLVTEHTDYIAYWSAGNLLYIWTPTAWLAWFLYTTGAFQRRPQTSAAALVGTPELEEAGA
jgi:hypothetical protein